MDKIKKLKGINNPYQKLCLVDNEKVRVEALKEVSKFFWTELKTRKRGNTVVENVFCKNEVLKELLIKKTITPDENKAIQTEIEKDLINIQKDLGFLQKTKEIKKEKSRIYKSITWLNLRKNFKEKILIPTWLWVKNFAKNHKLKILAVTWIVAYSTYSWIANIEEMRNISSIADEKEVIEYQDNIPWNVLDMPKTLEWEDYAKFVEKFSNFKISRNLKVKINSTEFKQFDKLYGFYMSKLQKLEKTKYWVELSKEEWKAFLVIQYIATNSHIDNLMNKQNILNWKDLEKNKYLVARYNIQLNSIEEAINDMGVNKEWNLQRKIKSWENYFTYYTDFKWSFYIDWIDKRKFNY